MDSPYFFSTNIYQLALVLETRAIRAIGAEFRIRKTIFTKPEFPRPYQFKVCFTAKLIRQVTGALSNYGNETSYRHAVLLHYTFIYSPCW